MTNNAERELLPCPFCGSKANADYFIPLESIEVVYCTNDKCVLHNADIGIDRNAWQARAQASGVPEGWKPVPVEPNDLMLNTFLSGYGARGGRFNAMHLRDRARRGYREMLAIAPIPPKSASVPDALVFDASADWVNPKSASVPVERLEALRRQKCTVWDGESGAIDQWEDDIDGDWVDWDDIVKLIAEYKA